MTSSGSSSYGSARASGKHSRTHLGSMDSSMVASESAAVVNFQTSGYTSKDALQKVAEEHEVPVSEKWVNRSSAPGSEQGSYQSVDKTAERRRHRCLMCCAWVFLVWFAIAVVVLALSFIFVAVLRSALPEVHLVQFNMPWLKIDTQPDIFMTSVVDAQIELYNQNTDTKLHYSDLWINVASDDIQLGETTFPAFVQDAKNRTILGVHTNTTKSVVNEDDANELKAESLKGQLVLDMILSGYIGFRFGILKLNRVPLLVVCEGIKQAQVDFLQQPAKCEVQIFKFR